MKCFLNEEIHKRYKFQKTEKKNFFQKSLKSMVPLNIASFIGATDFNAWISFPDHFLTKI